MKNYFNITDFNVRKDVSRAIDECLRFNGIELNVFREDLYSDWNAEINTKVHDNMAREELIEEVLGLIDKYPIDMDKCVNDVLLIHSTLNNLRESIVKLKEQK